MKWNEFSVDPIHGFYIPNVVISTFLPLSLGEAMNCIGHPLIIRIDVRTGHGNSFIIKKYLFKIFLF